MMFSWEGGRIERQRDSVRVRLYKQGRIHDQHTNHVICEWERVLRLSRPQGKGLDRKGLRLLVSVISSNSPLRT